jgi:hypothetical protein
MNKVEFSEILNLLLAENQDEAAEKLHEWFVSQSKTILESLQESDEDLEEGKSYKHGDDDDETDVKGKKRADTERKSSAKSKREIEEDVTITIDTDEDETFEPGMATISPEIPVGDFAQNEEFVDEAEVEFGDDDLGDDVDADVELPVGDEDEDEFDGEEAGEFGDEAEDLPVEDRVEDLEAQLAALQAEFAELMGADAEEAGEEAEDDAEDAEAEAEDDAEEVEEDVDGFTNDQFVAEDDDFDNLEESFELTKVKDPDMSEGSQAGDGGKAQVSKTSPIPQKKPEARVGGAAVEMKGKTHKGYAREASPGVNTKPILKNQVSNSKQDLTPVSPEGDKSALLNKAPVADKGKSPIGGGAVDLRGSDMKRKK